MARPRVLKIEEGEVVLKNFSKEKADELVALLSNKQTNVVSDEGVLPTQETIEVSTEGLQDKALGLRRDKDGSWMLVTVKYNHSTKLAVVDNIIDYKGEKGIAIGDMKVKIAKMFLGEQ